MQISVITASRTKQLGTLSSLQQEFFDELRSNGTSVIRHSSPSVGMLHSSSFVDMRLSSCYIPPLLRFIYSLYNERFWNSCYIICRSSSFLRTQIHRLLTNHHIFYSSNEHFSLISPRPSMVFPLAPRHFTSDYVTLKNNFSID